MMCVFFNFSRLFCRFQYISLSHFVIRNFIKYFILLILLQIYLFPFGVFIGIVYEHTDIFWLIYK
jgi:hypothetical protein